MNCEYNKLMPILTTDSSVDQLIESDFYERNTSLMSDRKDDRNERLLLQTDNNSHNYFGSIDNKGIYELFMIYFN
jgi:hypothetical protein